MKRVSFITGFLLLQFLYATLNPSKVNAQGYIICNVGAPDPCILTGNLCDSGYIPPSFGVGDPCVNYYAVNNVCPSQLNCVLPPTPTPTGGPTSTPPPPTPTYSAGACPGPYPYCDDTTLPCSGPEVCKPQGGVPSGCTGICVNPTLVPTAPPTGIPPGPTIEPYNPECPAASGTGIKTALGCIPTDATLFVAYALPWAIGFGGGVAFLLGIYGAFLIATASGDPEKVQAGKELITSVLIGVAVIAFSVLILRTIGVDILGIF